MDFEDFEGFKRIKNIKKLNVRSEERRVGKECM